jgi:hypothetical protein
MANDGKVVIELVGKDNATQTFVKSMQDMASSVKNLEASGQGLGFVGRMLGSLKGHVLKEDPMNLLSLYLVDLNNLTRPEKARAWWYAAIIFIPLAAVIAAHQFLGPSLERIMGR